MDDKMIQNKKYLNSVLKKSIKKKLDSNKQQKNSYGIKVGLTAPTMAKQDDQEEPQTESTHRE